MPKHIGIVACSIEGALLSYRTICSEGEKIMGEYNHPELTMHHHPMAEYIPYFDSFDWRGVADLMISSAEKVAKAGAQIAITPDNTIHQAWEYIEKESPIPWLHIADAVGEEAQKNGYKHLGITGTKYLMNGPVYTERLKKFGITCTMPDEKYHEEINRIIFGELQYLNFTPESMKFFIDQVGHLKDKGCDAVVLGCTEIPLLFDEIEKQGTLVSPLPTLDSTRLQARAVVKKALE